MNGSNECHIKLEDLRVGADICLSRLSPHLSGQILLHIVSGNEDPPFEPPALQLQILPLSPQQVGLLLCLEMNILWFCNK